MLTYFGCAIAAVILAFIVLLLTYITERPKKKHCNKRKVEMHKKGLK